MKERCTNCGTLIEGKTNVCPICGAKVNVDGDLAYAPRKKRVNFYKIPFTLYYAIVAALLTIASGVVNIYLNPSLPWWILSAITLLMLYFFLRHTVLGSRNLASKFAYVSFAALVFLYGVFSIFYKKVGFEIVIPCLALTFAIVTHAYVFATFKKSQGHLLSLMVADLYCLIPLIICAIFKFWLLPSIILAGISVIAYVVTFCVFPKEIVSEVKRFLAP